MQLIYVLSGKCQMSGRRVERIKSGRRRTMWGQGKNFARNCRFISSVMRIARLPMGTSFEEGSILGEALQHALQNVQRSGRVESQIIRRRADLAESLLSNAN